MVLLIIKLLILEVFIWVNAAYDTLRIRDGKPIYHGLEAFIRIAFICGLTLFYNWNIEAWKEAVFFATISWQYDYVLNFLRGKPWWYLGTAKLDLILKGKNLRYWRLGLKISLVIGSFILMVL